MAPLIVSRLTRWARVALFLAAWQLPSVARAEGSPDALRAQQLFDDARTLMSQGRFREACANFAESQRLDPGGGTILNLGICRKHEGRTATAFLVLSEALEQARAAGRHDRIATAERHLGELVPRLSRLTVRLPAEAAPDLVVELDGQRLSSEQFGTPLPLDPGPHELTATRPGHRAWSASVSLGMKSDLQTVDVPELTPAPPLPVPVVSAVPAVVAPAPRTEPAPPAPQPPPPAERKSANVLGYVLVGVGGAALVTGGYFGARALSLKADSDRYYANGYCQKQSCVDDWEDAQTAALVSNIGIGVGLAALGAGVYLLLRPSSPAETPRAVSLSLKTLRAGAAVTAGAEF